MVIVKDLEGKYILGTKAVYPPGIYRLLGGGINHGEDPQAAAAREITEELGIKRTSTELLPCADISIHIGSPEKSTDFHIYLFSTTLSPGESLKPGDDVDGIKHVDHEGMNALIDRFYDLSDGSDFSWNDYGKLYGRVHEIAISLS